jgi:hypothetical protein
VVAFQGPTISFQNWMLQRNQFIGWGLTIVFAFERAFWLAMFYDLVPIFFKKPFFLNNKET